MSSQRVMETCDIVATHSDTLKNGVSLIRCSKRISRRVTDDIRGDIGDIAPVTGPPETTR